MNKQTAQLMEKHFNTAFAAPDGIKKLRELILTLAMQGKLVPQDPQDQPASELLKEIEEEKKRLVKEGKIKAGSREDAKNAKEIGLGEAPCELPDGWEWVRFGSIAQHNSGKTLDKGRNTGQLCDYITTSNLYWGYFKLNSVRQMPIRDDELEKCTARKGDLLICEGGEAGRAAVWFYDKEICFQNHIHRARFYGDIDPHYAYHFFEKLNATGEICQHRQGVGISNMSGKALASIIFPLPPLAEQRRIVAKIELLMARCDELEKLRAEREQKRLTVHTAALNRLLMATENNDLSTVWRFVTQYFGELYSVKENVAELRKAILQLAVMGKQVPQDPKDQPTSQLLIEIETEKKRLVKEGKIKAPKPLPEIKPGEVPYELPEAWEWVRLGALAMSVDYGTSIKTGDDATKVPVYRMGNIVDGQLVNSGFKYIDHVIDDLPRLFLLENDILFNRTNSYELVGKTAIYLGQDDIATFASYLIRIRLIEKQLLPRYINLTMNAPYFRKTQIEPEIIQQCGQANFNGTKLSATLIPLPPISEQHRIVAKIDQLMNLCDELDKHIDASTQKQTALLNAVMAQV